MAMQVAALDRQIATKGVKCCVYGQSSAGKTKLCATAPRPVYIGCERGALSLRGSNIMSLPEIRTLAHVIEAHQWVMSSAEAKQFDTICFDSVSEVGDVILRTEKASTNNGLKAHGEANQRVLNNIYRDFRDLDGKHVYFIAKEKSFASTLNPGQRFYSPSMPNETMRNELPYFFDLVMRYLVIPQPGQQLPWRGLQTFADGNTIAKDRSGCLGPYEEPNLTAIFTKIMNGVSTHARI